MQNTKRKKNQSQEVEIPVSKYYGRNSWGNHSALSANESRELVNWDIFSGDGDDYLKSRKGSAFLKNASSPTKYGSTDIVNGITWDIGSEEYLITQIGTSFYSQALLTTGNPTLIAHVDGGTFTVTSTAQADMFLSGDKIYVFHAGGNKIIEWDSSGGVFKGRPMGRAYPVISTITTATAGAITGNYTVGVELVYRVSGADRDASTPNRKTAGRIIAKTGAIVSKKITLTLQATEIDADTTWTHLRVWRSKNKDTDFTDPLNPIDPQGTDSELYEEALITKAELNAGSLTAIATSSSLPVGNAGCEAGKPAGTYTVRLNNADSVFSVLVGIDQIELVPLPKANIGCFHGKRIFVSRIEDTTLDDRSKNNIYYSNFAGTKYGELHNPLNFINTGRDGQNMMKLVSMEKDLIGIKEAKTGRLPGGNVDQEYETLDFRIGISDKNAATYIPAIGICAITNDYSDFRIFGYDLRWNKELHGIDISTPIRLETQAMTLSGISFVYINGKIKICDGTGVFYALHEKNKRGWTKFSYPMNSLAQRAFVFANGSRAAVVSKSTHLVEIEKSVDVDVDTSDDTTSNDIDLSETTFRFKSKDARDILEFDSLSCQCLLTTHLVGAPYVNGKPWPNGTTETETSFIPDPSVYDSDAYLVDREYELFLEPETVGDFDFAPCLANTLHFVLTTTAPAIMRSKILKAVVDQDGMSGGYFDPFQGLLDKPVGPLWNTNLLLSLGFDASATTAMDSSGNSRHHAFSSVTGSRAHDSTMTPFGGETETGGVESGWIYSSWTGVTWISAGVPTSDFFLQCVHQPTSLSTAYTIWEGGDGTYFVRLKVNTDGSLEFQLYTSALTYKWTTAASVVAAGTKYTIQFCLTGDGATGQFYVASSASTLSTATTTTRSTFSFTSAAACDFGKSYYYNALTSSPGFYLDTASTAFSASGMAFGNLDGEFITNQLIAVTAATNFDFDITLASTTGSLVNGDEIAVKLRNQNTTDDILYITYYKTAGVNYLKTGTYAEPVLYTITSPTFPVSVKWKFVYVSGTNWTATLYINGVYVASQSSFSMNGGNPTGFRLEGVGSSALTLRETVTGLRISGTLTGSACQGVVPTYSRVLPGASGKISDLILSANALTLRKAIEYHNFVKNSS